MDENVMLHVEINKADDRGYYILSKVDTCFYLYTDGVVRKGAGSIIPNRYENIIAFWPTQEAAINFYFVWLADKTSQTAFAFDMYSNEYHRLNIKILGQIMANKKENNMNHNKEEHCSICEEVNKKNKTEKGIHIKYDRVWKNDKKVIKVTGIVALSASVLPDEYLNSKCAVWQESNSLESTKTEDTDFYLLTVGTEYDPEDFQERLNYIKKAGHNLTEMNRNRRAQRAWSGSRSIII